VRSYSDAAQRLARQSNMMKSLSQGLKVARNEEILLFFFKHESCTGTFSLVAFFPLLRG
jgi:hypothetical protein